MPARLLLASLLLLSMAPAALADPAAAELKFVPANAGGVAFMDHARLVEHSQYGAMQEFARAQGRGEGIRLAEAAGLAPGKGFQRTWTFEMGRGQEVTILAGGVDGDRLRDFAKRSMAAGYAEGEHAGIGWFRIAPAQRAAVLAPGVAVIAPAAKLDAVLEVAAGDKPALPGRKAFRALLAAAQKGSPAMWALAWVPKRVRDDMALGAAPELAKVERAVLRAEGKDAITFRVIGFATDAGSAKAAAKALQREIEAFAGSSPILTALGISALVRRVDVKSKGSQVLASIALEAAQLGLLARTGGRVIGLIQAR
ncbi:MAG: hypothetical protein H6744_17260 [Deltaproteobacteria bacterium]|nr:hypothetical protein [Deltaproteobacteria bacterium]MCB9788433.1 hypothetical protein [Deltaproteobacteria bacterium]